MKIKIIGAGSIGNHMAHGCRTQGWEVSICDVDRNALERTKSEIYPGRYGYWDEEIRLGTPEDFKEETFDISIIGTPPDTHVRIACSELSNPRASKVLMIEKPLCVPDLEEAALLNEAARNSSTRVLIGYNHRLTPHSVAARELITAGKIGNPLLLNAGFQEYWGGIFKAHPWLSGPSDTYLGFWKRGGGAGGEHSHGINIWQYFSELSGGGRISAVNALVEIRKEGGAEYDSICHINVRTENGLCGSILQDVITEPSRKWLRLQGTEGYVAWEVNRTAGNDALTWSVSDHTGDRDFPKTRPDDFKGELLHLSEIALSPSSYSPISLENGIATMQVLVAAHLSSRENRTAFIDHSATDLRKSVVFS